jgi:hypothetical protein
VRVDLQFKHADQIAAYRLDGFENRFLNMGLFAGGRNQAAHFDHVIEDGLQMLFQPGALNQIGEKPA